MKHTDGSTNAVTNNDGHQGRDSDSDYREDSEEWLSGVYSRQALITQVGGDDGVVEAARRGERVEGTATSSSSAPTPMSLMLHALDVRDGDHVLEIGTGTGYTAALLCERLGSDNVTSVDVEAALIDAARDRLSALGYAPYLAAVDGTKGCPERAPFDRVIATVGLRRVPPAWIKQTRAGGRILVPLDRTAAGGLLALLTVTSSDTAEGRFLPDYDGFMPLRANQSAPATRVLREISPDDGESRPTALLVNLLTDWRSPFESFAALTVGGAGWEWAQFTPTTADSPRHGSPNPMARGSATSPTPAAGTLCGRADPGGSGMTLKLPTPCGQTWGAQRRNVSA